MSAAQAERISLQRLSRTSGVAVIWLPGASIRGVRVQEEADGRLTVRPPDQVHLQPLWRELVEREISVLWARS